jgi:ABC-2 type transport system permease protein
MRKTLLIALREFRAVVGTKAFLISVLAMPVFMGGGLFAIEFLKNKGGIEEKKIVVIDHSGQFIVPIKMAAAANNELVDFLAAESAESGESDESGGGAATAESDGPPSFSKGSKYMIEEIDAEMVDDDLRLALCQRIREQELVAFVEIPAGILDEDKPDDVSIRMYSEDSGFTGLKQWLAQPINQRTRAIRYLELGLDADEVARATKRLDVESLGLLTRSGDGTIEPAEEKSELAAIAAPMVTMCFMFMAIILACQPMLESVLEEKSQRIAEVLLGCASPTQIMTGKLLGSVAGSLLVIVIYMVGGFALASFQGYANMFPMAIVPWFFLFQILGVLFFSAIYMAIGASVSQLKEAQSMAMPAMMLLMIPFFIWFPVVQEPNGPIAIWASLIPPATPGLMVMRMATGVTIPIWQPLLGAVLLAICVAAAIFVAARVFRVGILWQGKTPKLKELMQWAISS